MSVIFDWIVGLLLGLVGNVFFVISDKVYTVIGLRAGDNLPQLAEGYDIGKNVLGQDMMKNFFELFPTMKTIFDVFLMLAYLIVLALVINGMVKAMFGPFSRTAENPVILAIRGALATFLIRFSAVIAGFFLHLGTLLFVNFQYITPKETTTEAFQKAIAALGQATPEQVVGQTALMTVEAIGGKVTAIISGFLLLLLIVGLLSGYIRLVLEVIERYVTLCFLAIVSPLMVACITTSSTSVHFFSWIKMMLSQSVLMGFASLWLNAITYAMIYASVGGAARFGWIGTVLIITAMITLGGKIDQHMDKLGFTVAQGGDFGNQIFHAFAVSRGFAADANRFLGKMRGPKVPQSAEGQVKTTGVQTGDSALEKTKAVTGANLEAKNHKDVTMVSKNDGSKGIQSTDPETGKKQTAIILPGEGKDGEPVPGVELGDGSKMNAGEGKWTEEMTGSYSGAGLSEKLNSLSAKEQDINGMQVEIPEEAPGAELLGTETAKGSGGEDYTRQLLQKMPLQNGDVLMAVSDEETEGLGNEIIEAHTLGAGSFDKDGNLLTYNVGHGGVMHPELSGNGQYFKDADGNFVNFQDISKEGQTLLLGSASPDGSITSDIDGNVVQLAGDSFIHGDNGGLLKQTDTEDGKSYVSEFTPLTVKNQDTGKDMLTVTNQGYQLATSHDDILENGNIQFEEVRSGYNGRDLEKIDGLNEDCLFINHEKSPDEYEIFGNNPIELPKGVKRGDYYFEESYTPAGRWGTMENDHIQVINPKLPAKDGNYLHMDVDRLRNCEIANTVGNANFNGWLENSDRAGFSLDKGGNQQVYQFDRSVIENGRLRNTDGDIIDYDNADTSKVSVYNPSTGQNEIMDYNAIRRGYLGNVKTSVGGVETDRYGKVAVSDIHHTTNDGTYQTLHMRNGSNIIKTEKSLIEEDTLSSNNVSYATATTGSNLGRSGSEKVFSQMPSQFQGNYYVTGTGSGDFVRYSSVSAQKIYDELDSYFDEKMVSVDDVTSVTTSPSLGVTILGTADGEKYALVDRSINEGFRSNYTFYKNFKNKQGHTQSVVELGRVSQSQAEEMMRHDIQRGTKENFVSKLKNTFRRAKKNGHNVYYTN